MSYVESTEQYMLKIKIETNSDAEDRPIAVRGEGAGGWVKKGEGLIKKTLIDTDNGVVITRGNGIEGGRRR